MRISTTQVSSVMLRSKKLEIRGKKKELSDKNRFEMNVYKIYFFLDSSIHIRILKQVPKYLAIDK
jgi:hypothetical protein